MADLTWRGYASNVMGGCRKPYIGAMEDAEEDALFTHHAFESSQQASSAIHSSGQPLSPLLVATLGSLDSAGLMYEAQSLLVNIDISDVPSPRLPATYLEQVLLDVTCSP